MKPQGNGHLTLRDFDLPADGEPLPRDVRAFIREAGRRVERFQRSSPVPGFVASDFAGAYRRLRSVAATVPTPGRLFCEWGSGFGVVAGLAALLEFDAYGIEAEGALVEAARGLAADFGLDATFAHGSFIPPGYDVLADGDEFAWLTTEAASGHRALGLDPDDFDVTFAYPWPDEEQLAEDLFERYARPGAVLVTYHGADDLRLRQKPEVRGQKRGPRGNLSSDF